MRLEKNFFKSCSPKKEARFFGEMVDFKAVAGSGANIKVSQ